MDYSHTHIYIYIFFRSSDLQFSKVLSLKNVAIYDIHSSKPENQHREPQNSCKNEPPYNVMYKIYTFIE